MADIYTKSTSERKLDANKRSLIKLIGHEGNPAIEMTSYKFLNVSKVKESYYLASPETESGRTEGDEFFETQEEIPSSNTLKDNEEATHGETSTAESTSSVADKESISQLQSANFSTRSSPEHKATSESKIAKEKEKVIIRDKKINIEEDGTASTQKPSYNKPSSSPVDNAQNVCASTIRAKESKENRERGLLSTETIAGSCPIHDYPNTAYCLTCSVMVCEECLITVHNDTSGTSQCEMSSIYQMIDKFIIECNEYADEDIELTKDLKLNMTGITLYLHKEGNAISEKIANLKEELKRLEASLEKNKAMKSNVEKNEDHLNEWIIAIQFYKRTYSNLHLSSTSASDMKEIVKNRDRIQDQLGEYSLFVEEFKQKRPNFSFDILHLKDFDPQDKRQCDGYNTDDIVVILNDDDKPESDIQQQFSPLLASHDSSHSSLNICVTVEPDDQKSTAGELKNNHGKSFTQILGFFPDMSATSTPLPETFERVSKETASKETAYFSNTTDSQKSEDLLGHADTYKILLSYKQKQITVYGFDNKSENKTEIKIPSQLLADTLAHIPNPSLAESFQELTINAPPVEIKPESEETEIILNNEQHLTLPSNLSDQKVMQSSTKDSKSEASKTNRNDNITGSIPILGPKTIQKKSKRKKKYKSKSRSKSEMNVSDTDPKQIPESSVVKIQDAKTKKSKPLRTNQSITIHEKQGKNLELSNKNEISAADPTKNKFANNSKSENSKSKRETNAEADSQMDDYFFRPVLEPHSTILRAKLDGVQNQPSPSDLDLKDLDLTEDHGFEEQLGNGQCLQEYIASPSKYLLPTSRKMSDMKGPRPLQDSITATGGNLQQATTNASKYANRAPASGTKSKSKNKSKIKTDDNIDVLGKIMEQCLNVTSHQPDIPESTQHKLDDSEQNPSQSSHRASPDSLYNTETMDTQHIGKKEGAIPKRSTKTGKGIRKEKILCGAALEDSKDNDCSKTLTSSFGSCESDSIGLFPTPFLNPESTNHNVFFRVQDSVTCSTKSLPTDLSEESIKKNTSSSMPRVISVEPGSNFMKTFLLDCITEAMSKTKGYFKYKEEISSFEKEWLIQGGSHEKTESLEDDLLSDLEDSSKNQSPLSKISCLPKDKEAKVPGSSRSSTKEHLKEIALQISRVLNVDSAEVSKKCLTYVVSSDSTKANDNRDSEYIIETLPENKVRRFLSGEIIDEENYKVFERGVMQAVKHAQKQAKGIAKAGSLDNSSIPPITQALITVASKKSNVPVGSSRRAALTSRPSISTAAVEEPERREKRLSKRQKMRQEAMKTYKAD